MLEVIIKVNKAFDKQKNSEVLLYALINICFSLIL
jgi:hypothetical protein